jgi:dTDP-glucose 4,6-dehydratase
MKVAILGGGGCFALDFARHLHSLGIEHFGIGRSKPKPAPFWQVTHHYPYHALHLVEQLAATMAVLDTERPDVVVNYAAQGEGAASFGENAPDFFMTNCVGLIRLLLELQKRSYLKRFVHIGSSEVYGSEQNGAKETDPLVPTSPYGASKAAFDHYLGIMWRTSRFPMNIVRPSNSYVKGQQLHRIIPKTIICALKGEKLPLHGGGKSEKSYFHASDLSRAVSLVIQDAPFGTMYNVGPDEPISIRNLVELVLTHCGVKWEDIVQEVPERVGQDARYWLDCSAIKGLGWKQRVDMYDGVKQMVDWVRDYPELLTMDTAYRHRP